jgi:hypothetical protein
VVKWVKSCYEALVLWIDWHGRITTIVAIIVALGGTVLVNRLAAIWGQVHDTYLWVVSGLSFAVFLATIALIGRKLESREKHSQSIEISDQNKRAELPKPDRLPRLTIYAYRYPDVVLDAGMWRDANTSDNYYKKGLILLVRNDVYDDNSGIPANGLRVQLIWTYANGSPGPSFCPAPWLCEPLGIIDIPVGASGRLLIGTKNQNYWDGWANLRTSQTAHPTSESDMLPDRGTLRVKMIGATNTVWFEAYLKWETDLTYNHPRFRQITEGEAEKLNSHASSA